MNLKVVAKKKVNSKKASRDGTPTRSAKPVELIIHGSWSGSDLEPIKSLRYLDKIRRMPNPWVPTDFVVLIKFVCTYGATKAMVDLIKAWLDYRKAKKIEVRVGDYELKIEGPVSVKALENRINKFKELIRGADYDDIDVILPKGANRRMPPRSRK